MSIGARKTSAPPSSGEDLIGNNLLQSLIDSSSQNAGISTIQLPVATPIAPRKTPAPVHVAPDAQGTGAVDAKGASIVEVARRYLGTKYLWGGASPKTGFDCSGLLQWAAAQSGIKIPRTTYEQVKAGTPIAPGQLQAGDAVFFGNASAPHHVGIYIGGGKFLEAPHTGAVVRISSLAGRRDFAAARRYA
jgi:cell wall-associated NlpC family hydrolase